MIGILALHAAPGTGAASSGTPRPAAVAQADAGMKADLQSPHGFMLVVVDLGEGLEHSEAYGDWQWYLQSFIERRRGELPVHRITPQQSRALLPNWPSGLRSATLFANPHGSGLLHRGLVLEPMVYQIGKQFAEYGVVAPESASFGLEPFSWKADERCGPAPKVRR